MNFTKYTFPGGVVKVIARSSHRLRAFFLGKTYPFFKENGVFVARLPVPLGIEGKTSLVVEERIPFRKNRKIEKEIVVKAKKFRTSVIPVERGKLPSVSKKEKMSVRKKIRESTKKRFFGKFSYPLKKYNVTSEFGVKRVDKNGRVLWRHKGVDLAAPAGAPVFPASRGKVSLVLNSPLMGKSIFIDHGQGIISVYMHLGRINVKTGEIVTEKDEIGEVGSSGISTGSHLHLGIYLFGVPVDPVYALKIL
ncbi:MAG: M23 family metallopeptidase [Elusimicrobia bacterium]|nr:M23 family metallopeptidase [Elusimicrobiota bacterium]